ncbi:MAG: Stk1 family PASTA domain-containing Ser/Thr kinase [Actinobacteria bacterium]|nr:Stk1 family PASTA domain-containing Ser/Thr kinase [Actinomycetota bacterium]MCB9389976.1 Stk1 family PASTA domain-containing Ser/Thr kinase [Acidimicrobiia bacterium]
MNGLIFANRYEVIEPIAKGGMAEVFLAEDRLLNRPVAIKVLFPEYARDEAFVERFRREARAAGSLQHPNIVGVYDWGAEHGTYFIVMEYIPGETLRSLLKRYGALPPNEVARIGADIAGALHFAHGRGVVHRDVKPGNVLVTPDGDVEVTDFGIAQAGPSQDLTQTGSVMGTANYFSPEQAQGLPVDHRSDVYSLGVVLYEMSTGRPPFRGDNPVAVAYKHVREQATAPSKINPNVPKSLEFVIGTAMAKRPEHRYADAGELRTDLRRLLRNEPPKGSSMVGRSGAARRPTSQDAERQIRPRKRNGTPLMIAGLVMLIVAAVALIMLLIQQLRDKEGSGKEFMMESSIGQTEEVAVNVFEGLGLEVIVERKANERFPAGRVFDQDPGEGIIVSPGSEVTLWVSDGDTPDVVPGGIVGSSAEQVTQMLEGLDLGLTITTTRERSEEIERDAVISVDPGERQPLTTDQTVTLVVSDGPEDGTVPTGLLGLPYNEVRDLIKEAGFLPTPGLVQDGSVEPGNVIRVIPDQGSELQKGSEVQVIVAAGTSNVGQTPNVGAQTAVPSVLGQDPSTARANLQAAGFNVEVNASPGEPTSDPAKVGTIVAQEPLTGTAASGSTIRIAVGVPAG